MNLSVFFDIFFLLICSGMLEIAQMVGCDSDGSRRFQAANHLIGIFGIEESSFVVAFFWPGVGKIYMKTRNRVVGYRSGDEVGCIGSDHLCIFESPTAQAVYCVTVISARPFDA